MKSRSKSYDVLFNTRLKSQVLMAENMAHGDLQKRMQMQYGKVFRRVLNPWKSTELKMKFEENAEVGFEEWFNGNYGEFSSRSEWFYGDCEVKDEKIRKDLVYNWVRAAFLSGYEMGGALDELTHEN